MSKPQTNCIIRSLLKTHVIMNKHINMRRDINELFVSHEPSAKCSYEVLTCHHRYIDDYNTYTLGIHSLMVLSLDADATRCPEGEKHTDMTASYGEVK